MFQNPFAARLEAVSPTHPKPAPRWGFRRRPAQEAARRAPSAAVPTADTASDTTFGGFENFGRGGLDLGGLHRDQQWVGAWGGRC